MGTVGRPSKLDDIVAVEGESPRNRQATTISDRILAALRAGTPLEGAAASAGVSKKTIYDWLREGARLSALMQKPGKNRGVLTARKRRYLDFYTSAMKAIGDRETGANATLEQLSRGGIEVVTITERRDADDNLIDRTIRTEITPPDGKVLMTRLKQRFPDRYTETFRVEAVPIEERAQRILEQLTGEPEALESGE